MKLGDRHGQMEKRRISGLEIRIDVAALASRNKGDEKKYFKYLRIISTHFPSKMAESFLIYGYQKKYKCNHKELEQG